MEELRLVRREDRALIVASDAGEEFRLIVDDDLLAEVRSMSRRAQSSGKASPREIQALVRAGKSRSEIADLTGLEEGDIERYEEPVLAERRYILERAHAIPVRVSHEDGAEQHFGTVIAERLIGLGADDAVWSSWRDEEAGWMIGLEFTSHDIGHRAVWSFDHRKAQLAPLSPDAVTLSKQGDVGDRLIPKLRAVDDLGRSERFDSGAFDPDRLIAENDDDSDDAGSPVSGPVAPDHPSTGSIPTIDVDEEARRRTIDERAIKTPEPELPELGQTADLLDALRRRRGERGAAQTSDDGPETVNPPVQLPGFSDNAEDFDLSSDDDEDGTDAQTPANEEPPASESRRDRRRPQIPSWDDILFGTRSEEDPS